MGRLVLINMFEIKYKLCKRGTLTTANKPVYYLTITNKEEVIKELNLYPVNVFHAETESYFLHIDILVNSDKVSAFTNAKTNIKLYKDLTFNEVISMLDIFYNLKDKDFSNVRYRIKKEELINIMQLIIAKWDHWN